MTLTVSIIEDDVQTRGRLVDLVNASNRCQLFGSAQNGAEAKQLIAKDKTDVYLVDLGLPDVDGVELIKIIKKKCSAACSLVISTFGDAKHINRSIQAGATGYLLKDVSDVTLIDKIVTVYNGESPVTPSLVKLLFQQIAFHETKKVVDKSFDKFLLSDRELQVMCLLIRGWTTFNIGESLFISAHTVNQHLRAIYRKLDVNSRAMAVAVAVQHGLPNPQRGEYFASHPPL